MANASTIVFNQTLADDPDLCTLQTCPIAWATVTYDPSLAGNAFLLAVFAVCLVAQVVQGVMYRTWAFLVPWIFGLILECAGYGSRVSMAKNPFPSNPFLIYLICLTIAPAFLSAGIYVCLSRLIVAYGEHFARFKPRTYTIIFVCSDVFALVLQAIGGALADTADHGSPAQQTGINIMIAGLSFQVVSLTIFIALCVDFAIQIIRQRATPPQSLRLFYCSPARLYAFIFALASATITIYIRSCFRVAELKAGFNGKLANDEILFMILEGAMVSYACIVLTVMHPGPVFKDFWALNQARARLAGGEEEVSLRKVDVRKK